MTLRRAALVMLAALGLHQLRYLIGHGHESGEALAEHGHGYLAGSLPLLISAAVVVAAATLLVGVPRARTRRSARSNGTEAPTYALLLLAVLATQELVEGALFAGHPSGVDALLSHRGWLAIPLALFFGILVSLALGGLSAVERRLAGEPFEGRPPALPMQASCQRSDAPPLAARALAFGFARRPPPLFGLAT
jgi:hypothetical protein